MLDAYINVPETDEVEKARVVVTKFTKDYGDLMTAVVQTVRTYGNYYTINESGIDDCLGVLFDYLKGDVTLDSWQSFGKKERNNNHITKCKNELLSGIEGLPEREEKPPENIEADVDDLLTPRPAARFPSVNTWKTMEDALEKAGGLFNFIVRPDYEEYMRSRIANDHYIDGVRIVVNNDNDDSYREMKIKGIDLDEVATAKAAQEDLVEALCGEGYEKNVIPLLEALKTLETARLDAIKHETEAAKEAHQKAWRAKVETQKLERMAANNTLDESDDKIRNGQFIIDPLIVKTNKSRTAPPVLTLNIHLKSEWQNSTEGDAALEEARKLVSEMHRTEVLPKQPSFKLTSRNDAIITVECRDISEAQILWQFKLKEAIPRILKAKITGSSPPSVPPRP